MRLRDKIVLAAAALSLNLSAATTLEHRFAEPPFEARPWCFWYWMYGAVTEEGIKADLEAMKDAGLGGTYLMPIKSVETAPQFGGKAPQLSPRWWHLLGRSVEIADSLGLRLGMHICDGFALAGGPWISPAESMQKVVSADTLVNGGNLESLHLPQPETREGYYRDIALLALPAKGQDIHTEPIVTTGGKMTVGADGSIRSTAPGWAQYEYPEPVTVCN
ncbi:MAG: DNA-binding protein, partial [Duncaniella sp.]|nr:DNA-binding protein [Duncaniella sp.]